jgi:2-hydroxychromene-2-carboxylate isomerase
MTRPGPIDWYFDFVSPFAYLQSRRLETAVPVRERLVCHPVLFGAILDHWGQLGPAEIPAKRELTYRVVVWRAERDRIPLRMPPAHPFNPLPLLRLALAAGSSFTAVRRIFDWVWSEGNLPVETSGLSELATELGIGGAGDAIAAKAVKEQLRSETRAAIDAGVFGVPTAIVDGHLFWGDDTTDMLLDYCENPAAFDTEAYRSISRLPEGVRRRGASRVQRN